MSKEILSVKKNSLYYLTIRYTIPLQVRYNIVYDQGKRNNFLRG